MNAKLMAAGVMLLLGAMLPFLVIIGILESTFFLNFAAAAFSIMGIAIGFVGIIEYWQNKDKDKF